MLESLTNGADKRPTHILTQQVAMLTLMILAASERNNDPLGHLKASLVGPEGREHVLIQLQQAVLFGLVLFADSNTYW